MTKRRILSLLLSLVLAFSLLPAGAMAADTYDAEGIESKYFYEQLSDRQKAIYDELLDAFTGQKDSGFTIDDSYAGTTSIDLMDVDGIGEADVEAYIRGNKDIFNDFCAAKDALDLDHSELWWIDSGYLSFRVTKEDGSYHILVGPGRGDTYLLAGQEIKDAKDMDVKVQARINEIVQKAKEEAKEYNGAERTAALVRSVHNQIVESISYRYETECTEGNEKYIRTIYALLTHEGVCESYARAMQVCLTRLGVECVLIHGVQTKGTPEDHMWNAVKIEDNGETHWYAVDATWDDPVPVDWYGKPDFNKSENGLDGTETCTYLMVGQSVIGEYWQPSGYVSTGNKEFTYPQIDTSSYDGSIAYADDGLQVKYSATAGSVEDIPAGVFTVKYQGMNLQQAAEKGYYFLIKMYDFHSDGTAHLMADWYYAAAAAALVENRTYFGDTEDGLRVYTGTCEYVEVAVTTKRPVGYENWADRTDWSNYWKEPYYNGDGSDIIAQSGMLYNSEASYEAPPYVLTQFPAPNGSATAGYDYHFKVTYDDNLYHTLPERTESETAAVDNFSSDYEHASTQQVRVHYTTIQQDLHTGGIQYVEMAGDLPFDQDRDGYVDMDEAVNFKWIYPETCPIHKGDTEQCDVNEGCPIIGAEFDFRASDMWADDGTEYCFNIEGVVGSRSQKYPNSASVYARVPGQCPICYRSQGIDWNLWGQPTLLDAPENLNLHNMAVAGGTDGDALAALDKQINQNGFNGRLMLVVEDNSKGSGDREEYTKVNDKLEDQLNMKDKDIKASSVFEINFDRICPMVKLKPGAGESIRVQVGYPAGITYEDIVGDNPNTVLKAYHFTRCDANHLCGKQNEENHEWGDDIVGVDEIQVIPNPYGMVILCNSFSPFEIVALDANSDAVKNVVEESSCNYDLKKAVITVVSAANGKVKIDGTETYAIGGDGDVTFQEGDSRTFTIVPDEGYEVDTVSLGGKEIKPDEQGKFTLTMDEDAAAEEGTGIVTGNDVLNVTFLPEKIKENDKEKGVETVVAAVCTHSETREVPVNGHDEDVDPTCTDEGYVLATECVTCGQTITEGHSIPATGHNFEITKEAQAPTCTETGWTAATKCTKCDATVESTEIPALGHDYVDGVCTRCREQDPNASTTPGNNSSGSTASKDQTTTSTDSEGTRTTTTTHSDGSVSETKTTKDGVVGKTETDKNGRLTSAEVSVPASAAKEGTVTAPIEVDAAKDSKAAPEIDVKVNGGGSAKVEIPVTKFGPGTVAVVVHDDGTEEIVRDCVTGENGVVLNVEGNVTLKIVDNTKTFTDVEPVNHWASDAVEFVAARELFNGTGDGKFTPNGDMTRGMLVTVLYRLAYEPETAAEDFADVDVSAYYADAVAWAADNGVVNGYGGGKFGPNDDVTREQIVTILYRYAEKNGYLTGKTGSLSGYADAGSVSGWAADAMGWAIETGLVKGVDATHLAPAKDATRAEVATILMRFCEDIVK